MLQNVALKDHHIESRLFFGRAMVSLAVVFILIIVLISRLFYLQIMEFESYRTESDNNHLRQQAIPPTRGLIYDRNGVLLADNRPIHSLTLVKERISHFSQTIQLLKSLIGISDEEIERYKQRLKSSRHPYEAIPLRYRLTAQDIAIISVNRYRLSGVEVEARLVRYYPLGESTAHSVGYVGSITQEEQAKLDEANYKRTYYIGKSGVEKFYESILHGQVGSQKVEKNASGRILREIERNNPIPGIDLVLHLDSELQIKTEEILGDHRGAIVAIEPQTGGILAIVSKPSFNPNLFVTGISNKTFAGLRDSMDKPLFNRALMGQYSPGSTIKPFVALAALNKGVVSYETKIFDPGWYKLKNDERRYHNWTWWKDKTGHGWVDMQKAIYQSNDVFFYDLAIKLGIDNIHEHLWKYGFGQNLTIDVPEAKKGILPSTAWKMASTGQVWFPGETIISAIGQGNMLTTPIQLATATAVLANKGQWKRPRMLREIINQQLPADFDKSSPSGIQLTNPNHWDYIFQALEKVVHRGSKYGYRDGGSAWPYIAMKKKMAYRMAGKSGTVQIISINLKEDEKYDKEKIPERLRDHALFIAFAPVADPQIVLAVVVENGMGGSSVAGPLARRVVDAYLLRDKSALKAANANSFKPGTINSGAIKPSTIRPSTINPNAVSQR